MFSPNHDVPFPDFGDVEAPWWYMRCTHRSHNYAILDGVEYGCWRVMREAEGVVVAHLRCLHQVHVVVDRPGLGSICKTLTQENYYLMEETDLLAFVQEQLVNLKQSLA